MSEPLDRVCEYQPKGAHIPSLSISSGTAVSSIRDLEKAEYAFDDDEKALAQYIVPVLEKGVKTALANPPSYFTRFRVWYNPYRLLFTFVFTLNMAGILVACLHHFPYAEKHSAALALGNILAAVACRNEFFLRYLFWAVVKLFQKWTPLWFRIWWTAFLQHIGGIHSGSAASGVAWFMFAVVRSFQQHVEKHTQKVVLAWGIITLSFTGITMIAAAPWIRHYHHNFFEYHHRFAGWSSVAFVWIFVCISDSTNAGGGFTDDNRTLIHAQEFWFALVITILIVIPWFTVRKVPVEITVLDNWFLIWIGSDMEKTFGPVLFDMIKRRIPKERYILFDTKKEGCRPDTMKMLKDIYVAFSAEVVIITSNPKGNEELMQGCKDNDMHAFGPLWDS
ncbi:hypothetical protein EW026_g1464 [Hermanssonia centrifuga]|uniref:Uncharacterized protein n=1 Tax=Hermanssonia centrifuga TaxID=98765 RepID=A0A4S4KS97_9APHY|nr:hypothetical protein EW026_g1464 [Hermanssonia centrifuga]